MADAASLQPELAAVAEAQRRALENLPSLFLFGNDVLIVTQTTIEETVPCPLSRASRALGRFFKTNGLQEQAKLQHTFNHMKALAKAMLPALLRPKPVGVSDIATKWFEELTKKDGANGTEERPPADSLSAV